MTVSLSSTALQDIASLGEFPLYDKTAYESEKFSGLLNFKTEREMNIEAIVKETWSVLRMTDQREDQT